jgi:hypothetical protein
MEAVARIVEQHNKRMAEKRRMSGRPPERLGDPALALVVTAPPGSYEPADRQH